MARLESVVPNEEGSRLQALGSLPLAAGTVVAHEHGHAMASPTAASLDGSDDGVDADGLPELAPGRVRLGPDVITPQSLDAIAELAKGIHLKGALSPSRMNAIMSEIRDKQSISRDDLRALNGFVARVRVWHRELHAKYREESYDDARINERLMTSHQFLHQWDGATERYRIQARTHELARIADGSPSVSPTTSAFYTFAQITQKDMKEVLALMDAQHTGASSATLVGGNRARTLTRNEIWETKMKLLDEAIAGAKAGHPVEIDVQYYELTSQTMLHKLVEAGRAGNKVRVNLDPGRLVPDRDGNINAGEVARKTLSVYRLLDAADEGGDVAVTLFPVAREIGEVNLMHQKLFRVGDRVILGGMNANSQSGENIDAAVLLEGPAARRLVSVFRRDANLSAAAKLNDIYNPEHSALISAGGMYVGPSALMALLLNAAGKKTRAVDAPRLNSDAETVTRLAEAAGANINTLIDFTDNSGDGKTDGKDLEKFLADGDAPSNVLPLKREGGRLLARQLKEIIEKMTSDENVTRAKSISDPSDAVRGKDVVGIGDGPDERTAIMLEAIASAEKFMYIPSFVMTRVVARAVAARYQELKAQGKTLDVRVVLDPGIYPDGGTPNEAGYLSLEDAGIPVRWALLTRTDPHHDRKVHAKAVITEKMAFLGSTNMSTKGLKSNWELSGLVKFDPDDAESQAQKQHLVDDFLETWDHESIRIDTHAVADTRLQGVRTADHEARVEEARHGVVMSTLRVINNYGRDSARVVAQLLAEHPELAEEVRARVASGTTEGYAMLHTIQGRLGSDALRGALAKLDSANTLAELAAGRYPFKK